METIRLESRGDTRRSQRSKQGQGKTKKRLTYVLRLNVGVDKVAFVVEVLEAKKDLFCDDLDNCARHPFLLVPLQERKEIFTERFENDADMRCFEALVRERIKEGNDMRSARMCGRNGGYARKQLDFVSSSFSISASGFYNLERRM
jgi:hypothetical protein